MDPELDPELAELLRLEEQERAANPGGSELDPELLAEILELQEDERIRRERGDNPF